MDQNLSVMSKSELENRLKNIRADRRTAYAPPQKKKGKVDPKFADLSPEIAAKILAELAEGLPDVKGE